MECTLIYCNTAVRGLTDIYYTHDSRGRAAPKGECGYISKTLSTSVYNIYVTLSIVVYSAARNYPGITML